MQKNSEALEYQSDPRCGVGANNEGVGGRKGAGVDPDPHLGRQRNSDPQSSDCGSAAKDTRKTFENAAIFSIYNLFFLVPTKYVQSMGKTA
jgi:hypothetical protein